MSTIHPFPNDRQVHEMLGMLFGDGMDVKSVDPVSIDADGKVMVAVFVNDQGNPVTACLCDLSFSAFAGAALSMIPAGGARDAAKSGELSEMMQGNLNEIMNICSRLFIGKETPHLKLDKVYSNSSELPDSAHTMLEASTGRSDFEVTIPGYGEGQISFLST